jgi:hypothetical protein
MHVLSDRNSGMVSSCARKDPHVMRKIDITVVLRGSAEM